MCRMHLPVWLLLIFVSVPNMFLPCNGLPKGVRRFKVCHGVRCQIVRSSESPDTLFQMDPFLFSRWSRWSSCSRNCLTTRTRACKFPIICGNKIVHEEAFCYLRNTHCEKIFLNNRRNFFLYDETEEDDFAHNQLPAQTSFNNNNNFLNPHSISQSTEESTENNLILGKKPGRRRQKSTPKPNRVQHEVSNISPNRTESWNSNFRNPPRRTEWENHNRRRTPERIEPVWDEGTQVNHNNQNHNNQNHNNQNLNNQNHNDNHNEGRFNNEEFWDQLNPNNQQLFEGEKWNDNNQNNGNFQQQNHNEENWDFNSARNRRRPNHQNHNAGQGFENGVDSWVNPEDRRRDPTYFPQCGVAKMRERDSRGIALRILGGRESRKGRWPWQVAIINRLQESFCGGTLLSPRWILTAAHCVRRRITVIIGEHHLHEEEGTERQYKIEAAFIHPDFDPVTVDNDIALLLLPKPVDVEAGLACLPWENQPLPAPQTLCAILGWGKEHPHDVFGTTVLHEGMVPLVSTSECKHVYGRHGITRNMFCAGFRSGNVDSCAGDSGGPLLCSIDNRWTVFGVTSFGDGCGRKGKYGIYAKVPNYVGWIRKVMEANEFL